MADVHPNPPSEAYTHRAAPAPVPHTLEAIRIFVKLAPGGDAAPGGTHG